MSEQAPLCAECHEQGELVTGKEIYPHRSDLFHMHFWLCRPCFAYVGCHPSGRGYGDGTRPLGTMANVVTRNARKAAHEAFDPLWRVGFMSRHQAYRALAKYLELPTDACHIGSFDAPTCNKVIQWAKHHIKNTR